MLKKPEPKDPQTFAIMGAAMEVHRNLGSGFLEAVYQEALAEEFNLRQIQYQREVNLEIFYKNKKLACHYRVDFVCYEHIILELKALSDITGREEAQRLNYLKATGYSKGLILNFGRSPLQPKRMVN